MYRFQRRSLLGLGVLAAVFLFLGIAGRADSPPRQVGTQLDFDKSVAPVLIERCIDCHSGPRPKGKLNLSRKKDALKGGRTGPAIVPGKLGDSLLWERVAAGEMPPKKPLPEADKAVLKAWIAQGAHWGTDPIDPFRFTTSKRAGLDWWSLQPVRRPALPAVKDLAWEKNPIDRFVLAGLEKRGLKPSPEADRRTLIRRLYFDLLGLPPTPEAVTTFVNDRRAGAYERLVDELLASPHYGERWARHWLDVVRYGESGGFERNDARPNAWHYRDWVVRALNADLPYDKFCRLQIAGDVLRPDDVEALKATGYLVAGIHNTVVPMNKTAEEIARQDEMEDLVGSVGQTFLGLTVHCGRCHDHKFDPIAQKDFYRLASALSGVQHGNRVVLPPATKAELTRTVVERKQAEQQLAAIEEPARRAALAAKKAAHVNVLPPGPIAAWDFRRDGKDHVGGLHVELVGGAKLSPAGLVVNGKGACARTGLLARDLRAKTLEAWVRLDNLDQRGGGVMSVESPDGMVFDAVVFGEREPKRWLAGSNGFQRTESFAGPAEAEASRQPVHVAIAYHEDGTIVGYRNGRLYGRSYRSKGPQMFSAGKAVVAFGLRHEPAGGDHLLAGTIVQARLYDRALTAEEIAASADLGDIVTETDLAAQLDAEGRRQRDELRGRLTSLSARAKRLQGQGAMKFYATIAKEPPVTRLLIRGQVTEPAEIMAPGGVAAVGGARANFGLPPNAPEGERRKKLAQWLTHPDNPLFTRVMVNRLWHYHFGTGIVDTPNDLGFNGSRPSHPELLDWLAAEFVKNGFRLKEMHRLMVTARTYRQSSAPTAAGLAADADNRLLWRKQPRMEAEVLRDSLLAVTGLLNREIGGRGFSDYRAHGNSGTTYYDPIDPVGASFQRRSIYRFQPRSANQGLLDVSVSHGLRALMNSHTDTE